MSVKDVIDKENIIISNSSMNKQTAIDEMVSLLNKNGYVSDADSFKAAVNKREREISTAVGYGVAIPHGKSEGVSESTIVILKNLNGISWDNETVNLVFMIAAPMDANDEHLRMLSTISTYLMDETFRAKLLTAMNKDDIYKDFIDESEEKSKQSSLDNATKNNGKYLIGISACMTGIAHTYMAAESLQNEAKKRGMKYKIQTNGSTGIENQLTSQDINEADAIVVAHDVRVDTSVFGDKNFVDVAVKKAIDKPAEVID